MHMRLFTASATFPESWRSSRPATEAAGRKSSEGAVPPVDAAQPKEKTVEATTKKAHAEPKSPHALTPEEERLLVSLRSRDAEVRAHEAAHLSVGGSLTRGVSYSYQTGPDGRSYAVGGDVSIDVSPGRTPEETISKAQRVRAAATAPAQPSAQDLQVASRASQMEMEARLQLLQALASSRDASTRPAGEHQNEREACGLCQRASREYSGMLSSSPKRQTEVSA